jgi:hypothetical protein
MVGDRAESRTESLLHIYLNDHRAAMSAERSLVRRMLGSNEGTPYHGSLQEIDGELAEEQRTLDEVAKALGVRRNVAKLALAVVGERIGRLKLNGSVRQYSPLSRVLELEGLQVAAAMRRALWTALSEVSGNEPTLSRFDFDRLRQRADEQIERLGPLHRQAARQAMGSVPADQPGDRIVSGGEASGGGPGVTPTATTAGAADTSVFEPDGAPTSLAAREAELQSVDEDTVPPAT